MPSSPRTGLNAGMVLAMLTGAATLTVPAEAQVNNFNFFKIGYYNQSAPTAQALQNFYFDSTVFVGNPTDATAATLTPGVNAAPLSYYYTSAATAQGANLNLSAGPFGTQASLDGAFPQGTYTVNYGGGTETPGDFSVDYSTDAYAVNTPLFSAATYTGLQNLTANQAFTLNWNANVPGGAANDPLSFLDIYDATTGSLVFSDDFLAPGVTSALLPAGTLLPDTSYFADIDFSDRIDGPGADVTDSNGNNIFVTQAFDLQNTVAFTTAPAAVPEAGPSALLTLGVLPLGLLAARRRRA